MIGRTKQLFTSLRFQADNLILSGIIDIFHLYGLSVRCTHHIINSDFADLFPGAILHVNQTVTSHAAPPEPDIWNITDIAFLRLFPFIAPHADSHRLELYSCTDIHHLKRNNRIKHDMSIVHHMTGLKLLSPVMIFKSVIIAAFIQLPFYFCIACDRFPAGARNSNLILVIKIKKGIQLFLLAGLIEYGFTSYRKISWRHRHFK